MRKEGRILSVFLCVTLLFLSVFVPNALAESKQMRVVTQSGGSSVNLRKNPSTQSDSLVSIYAGVVVQTNGTEEGEAVSGVTTWYKVNYGDFSGYMNAKYLADVNSSYDADFQKNLLNFPEDYRESLKALHAKYPNWKFIAEKVNVSLETAINYEYSASYVKQTKKWVDYKLNGNSEWIDSRVDLNNSSYIKESRWTYASKSAIAYFMDPRNALTDSNTVYYYPNIFQFLSHTYDPAIQTTEGLRTVIKGSFLENGYDGNKDAYVNDIMQAAAESGISPYVIAALIKVEQGTKGTSSLISGTYIYKYTDDSGVEKEIDYTGYYNFFNYGATGDNVVKNGLEYAKSKGWSTRREAIIGGAKLHKNYYIDRSQDTYYYKDFDVWGSGSHQYATSVYDQATKGYALKSVCISDTNSALTFKIPVYSSMSESAYAAPSNTNNNSASATQPTTPARRKGDFDGDGQVTVKELATIRMYLLGVKNLSVLERSYLDVNGDNEITVKDLALVRMYLLGLINI